MAFATSGISMENLGSVNELKGTWTCSIGDAAGTVTVAGIAIDADFKQNATTGPIQERIHISGLGTATVTVYNLTDVSNGRFRIRYK